MKSFERGVCLRWLHEVPRSGNDAHSNEATLSRRTDEPYLRLWWQVDVCHNTNRGRNHRYGLKCNIAINAAIPGQIYTISRLTP